MTTISKDNHERQSPTFGGVSNPWPLAEPSCLDTRIDPEAGTEIRGPGGRVYASVANPVVGAMSMLFWAFAKKPERES